MNNFDLTFKSDYQYLLTVKVDLFCVTLSLKVHYFQPRDLALIPVCIGEPFFLGFKVNNRCFTGVQPVAKSDHFCPLQSTKKTRIFHLLTDIYSNIKDLQKHSKSDWKSSCRRFDSVPRHQLQNSRSSAMCRAGPFSFVLSRHSSLSSPVWVFKRATADTIIGRNQTCPKGTCACPAKTLATAEVYPSSWRTRMVGFHLSIVALLEGRGIP
jgi:hypothetical protein